MTASKHDGFGPPGGEQAGPAEPAETGLSSLLRRGVKAAIARWAVRHRSEAEIWPRPQDEAPHAWDGRPHFAEDYTLAAVQPGLALVARIEWLPGRDAHRIWLTILTPTAVYALPGTGQALLRGGGDHWRAGGLAFDCVEPLRTWTLRYRGRLEVRDAEGQRRGPVGEELPAEDLEVRVDLTFVSQLPAFVPGSDDDPDLVSRQVGAADWDARLLKQLRRDRLRSYVQAGEVHGALVLGSSLSTFGGAGLRQHSWGVRDWGASDAAMQCFAHLAGEQGAGPVRAWVHSAQFPWIHLAGGFVQRAAGLVPIRDLGVAPTRRPGRAPSHVGLHIDAPGGALELEVETIAELALDMDGRGRLEFSLCRVRQAHAEDHGAGAGWALLITQRRLVPRSGEAPP
ncbi:MAG: hypothetical protein H0T76_00950 [Nannocystis sp.]|nr:hypothetical protein [Nannocystis sp.]MBA3545028.1 hypothetical protein [Nannocystis sp.]